MASRKTSNLPVNYEEQLAAEAKAIATQIGSATGDRVRSKGNLHFILPDGSEGTEFEVVVVAFMTHNLFYDRPYDPNNPIPPACLAIGPEPTQLTPSPNSPDVQAESCSVCPNNQFNSALNGGKGKACKNSRVLALIPTTALEDPNDAPLWTLGVPPAALQYFDGYVRMLANKHRTSPIGVITSVTLAEGSEYFSPRFSVVRPLAPKELAIFFERRAEAEARLREEPDLSSYTPPVNNRRGAAPVKPVKKSAVKR